MLIVRPVSDPDESARLCLEYGRTPGSDVMAYHAVEAKDPDDGSPVSLGLCRFTLADGKDEILSLDFAAGTHDAEAMIITARAVMSFMHRCGVKTVYASDDIPDELIAPLGFGMTEGRLSLNLEEFYKSPCHYKP
ncbi:MAG: hypothetical protein IJK58_00980 [Clostridia bacterium]|nr:hypothetical protein [Clostridia bacterium]